jgi:N-acetylneuraminate synthase/N,N'-diacetyllegionaminate synthase
MNNLISIDTFKKHKTNEKTLQKSEKVVEELKIILYIIELAISGNGIKTPSESEINNIAIARKSIHITNDLPSGHIITESDLIALRPGDGISPMVWETIIGKKLTVNKLKFDKLNFSDIQ